MGRRLTALVVLGVVGTLVLFHLAGHDPAESHASPRCFFREATGWHCAGCGATRATYALLHLDLVGALGMNALWVILLPFVMAGAGMVGAGWLLQDRYRGPRLHMPRSAAWWLPAILLGFWVLRNVPIWPFTLLAPG